MSTNKYCISEIRVRNSSLGRSKPIHFKGNDIWDINDTICTIRNTANQYFEDYKLPNFYPQFLLFPKAFHDKFYIEHHIPYIQSTIHITMDKHSSNYFKNYDELEDYLMKYFFTSAVEYNFFNYYKLCEEQSDQTISYYINKLLELENQMKALNDSGIADLKAEYEKYKETSKSNLPIILYTNWKKYKENKHWIEDEISKSENTSYLYSASENYKINNNNNPFGSNMDMITEFYKC